MIAYHIDRSGLLVPNQTISLVDDIRLGSLFDCYNNSFSNHGLQYLNQYSDSAVWELCMEFIRQNHFSQYPSRLQSFFGTKTYEEALVWKGYMSIQTNSKINICKIEFENCHEFDARWITNPPESTNTPSNFQFQTPSIAKMLDLSYKYWNKEKSLNPFFELLISMPIKIVEIL